MNDGLEVFLQLERQQYLENEVINGVAALRGGKKERKIKGVRVELHEYWQETRREWVSDDYGGHYEDRTYTYDEVRAKQKFPGGKYGNSDQQTFSFALQLPPVMNWYHQWFVLLSADIRWRPDKNAKVIITRGYGAPPTTPPQFAATQFNQPNYAPPPSTPTPPPGGTPIQPQSFQSATSGFCPNCGGPVAGGKFCGYCGSPL